MSDLGGKEPRSSARSASADLSGSDDDASSSSDARSNLSPVARDPPSPSEARDANLMDPAPSAASRGSSAGVSQDVFSASPGGPSSDDPSGTSRSSPTSPPPVASGVVEGHAGSSTPGTRTDAVDAAEETTLPFSAENSFAAGSNTGSESDAGLDDDGTVILSFFIDPPYLDVDDSNATLYVDAAVRYSFRSRAVVNEATDIESLSEAVLVELEPAVEKALRRLGLRTGDVGALLPLLIEPPSEFVSDSALQEYAASLWRAASGKHLRVDSAELTSLLRSVHATQPNSLSLHLTVAASEGLGKKLFKRGLVALFKLKLFSILLEMYGSPVDGLSVGLLSPSPSRAVGAGVSPSSSFASAGVISVSPTTAFTYPPLPPHLTPFSPMQFSPAAARATQSGVRVGGGTVGWTEGGGNPKSTKKRGGGKEQRKVKAAEDTAAPPSPPPAQGQEKARGKEAEARLVLFLHLVVVVVFVVHTAVGWPELLLLLFREQDHCGQQRSPVVAGATQTGDRPAWRPTDRHPGAGPALAGGRDSHDGWTRKVGQRVDPGPGPGV